MALTTEDIKQIKEVVIEVVDDRVEPRFMRMESLIESLALAAKEQFDDIDERFNAVDQRFNQIDSQLDRIREDLVVHKEISGDHSFRITKLEHQHKSQPNLAA